MFDRNKVSTMEFNYFSVFGRNESYVFNFT